MTKDKIQKNALIAACYAFFIPSLYIILTDSRKQEILAENAAQALLLWLSYFIVIWFLRAIILLSGLFVLFPILSIINAFFILLVASCSFKALRGEKIELPRLSGLAKKIC